MKMIISVIASCLLFVIVSETHAQSSISTLHSVDNGKTGFVGLELISIDGQPLACYGLHKYKTTGTPGFKSSFTYLILFKNSDKTTATAKGTGTVSTTTGGQIACDLKMTTTTAGRTIQVDYKLEEAGDGTMKETLSVDGNLQQAEGARGARVYLVDLSRPEAAIESVKVVPPTVPDISNRKQRSQQIQQVITDLKKQSAKVRTFLED